MGIIFNSFAKLVVTLLFKYENSQRPIDQLDLQNFSYSPSIILLSNTACPVIHQMLKLEYTT